MPQACICQMRKNFSFSLTVSIPLSSKGNFAEENYKFLKAFFHHVLSFFFYHLFKLSFILDMKTFFMVMQTMYKHFKDTFLKKTFILLYFWNKKWSTKHSGLYLIITNSLSITFRIKTFIILLGGPGNSKLQVRLLFLLTH